MEHVSVFYDTKLMDLITTHLAEGISESHYPEIAEDFRQVILDTLIVATVRIAINENGDDKLIPIANNVKQAIRESLIDQGEEDLVSCCGCDEEVPRNEAWYGDEGIYCHDCHEDGFKPCDICHDYFPLDEMAPHGPDTGVDPAGWICLECNQSEEEEVSDD